MTKDANRYKRTYPISWDQLHRDSRALAWRLLEFDFFKGIIAVTRGGMVPASVVARELDIRLVETVCVASYAWQDQQGEMQILKSLDDTGEGWLIIDDLADTGMTAKIVREMLPEAHFAAVYAKPAGRPLVDTFITEVSQDTWILFPWDTETQFIDPIIHQKRKIP